MRERDIGLHLHVSQIKPVELVGAWRNESRHKSRFPPVILAFTAAAAGAAARPQHFSKWEGNSVPTKSGPISGQMTECGTEARTR